MTSRANGRRLGNSTVGWAQQKRQPPAQRQAKRSEATGIATLDDDAYTNATSRRDAGQTPDAEWQRHQPQTAPPPNTFLLTPAEVEFVARHCPCLRGLLATVVSMAHATPTGAASISFLLTAVHPPCVLPLPVAVGADPSHGMQQIERAAFGYTGSLAENDASLPAAPGDTLGVEGACRDVSETALPEHGGRDSTGIGRITLAGDLAKLGAIDPHRTRERTEEAAAAFARTIEAAVESRRRLADTKASQKKVPCVDEGRDVGPRPCADNVFADARNPFTIKAAAPNALRKSSRQRAHRKTADGDNHDRQDISNDDNDRDENKGEKEKGDGGGDLVFIVESKSETLRDSAPAQPQRAPYTRDTVRLVIDMCIMSQLEGAANIIAHVINEYVPDAATTSHSVVLRESDDDFGVYKRAGFDRMLEAVRGLPKMRDTTALELARRGIVQTGTLHPVDRYNTQIVDVLPKAQATEAGRACDLVATHRGRRWGAVPDGRWTRLRISVSEDDAQRHAGRVAGALRGFLRTAKGVGCLSRTVPPSCTVFWFVRTLSAQPPPPPRSLSLVSDADPLTKRDDEAKTQEEAWAPTAPGALSTNGAD